MRNCFAARLEDRVFGVGVLREQTRDRRGRPQRSIRIRAAGERVVRAAAAPLCEEPRREQQSHPAESDRDTDTFELNHDLRTSSIVWGR